MTTNVKILAAAAVLAVAAATASGVADASPAAVAVGKATLWRPIDVASADLIYGAGGRQDMPRGPFRFVKEDTSQSSPKYDVVDAAGVKWKVKLGQEAQPETAAARLLWAAGYATAEIYYLPEVAVAGLPAKVHRGSKFIDENGVMHGARFKREPEGAKKLGHWKWKENPFVGTREFNGLRTMMALLNNWDVKDENTAIYREDGADVYQVSDLGATFASAGYAFPQGESKGNLEQYERSDFICKTGEQAIDFCAPGRSALFRMVTPKEFVYRMQLRWIGRDIPRADARWVGQGLSRLSRKQVRDAFVAAGYELNAADMFARIVERRIGQLLEL